MFRKLLFKDLTFTDIHTLYSDPREAERFFFDLKWKDGFVCSKCGHTHCTTVIRKNGSLRTVYQCSHCGHQESATVGTALEDTKAPLFSWILVMFVFVMSKTGTSAKYISNLTGVSYHTTKFMLRKIRQAQKQDNETHAATDCDAIGLDVFSYCGKKHENGGKKHGKRGWGAEGKGNVAAAVIRQYVWEDTNGDEEVFEAADAAKFKIAGSENKTELKKFLEKAVPGDCAVHCDRSSASPALDIAGKLVDAQKSEVDTDRLSSPDHVISSFRSKVQGTTHGITLQFPENELADFEWKLSRRKWKKSILASLGRTLIKGTHQTRERLISHFKGIQKQLATA